MIDSTSYLYVYPVSGCKVRDPRPGKPKFLPETGDTVPNDPYWRRRITEGSCAKREPKADRPSKTKNSSEAKG